jgi:hypothetical protein
MQGRGGGQLQANRIIANLRKVVHRILQLPDL